MADRALAPRADLVMDGIAVLCIGAIATLAQASGWYYLAFPGLGAISHDVLTRPWGKWASQPVRLILTPVLAAVVGTGISRKLPYHALTIMLVVTACLVLLKALKSHMVPAVSAGVLPIVLDVKNWLYPASIGLGLVALSGILLPWRSYYRRKYRAFLQVSDVDLDDVFETRPTGGKWILPFFLFLAVMASCATASGLRLMLIPPLIVTAYEMFAHPTSCPWAGKPLALPVACVLISGAGLVAVSVQPINGIAAGFDMAFGIVVLRVLKIHMPPALAVGLLPLVIHSPGISYPVCVGIGTAALTLTFLLYRRWVLAPRAGRGQCLDRVRSSRCPMRN